MLEAGGRVEQSCDLVPAQHHGQGLRGCTARISLRARSGRSIVCVKKNRNAETRRRHAVRDRAQSRRNS
jgi:hypothetical protein